MKNHLIYVLMGEIALKVDNTIITNHGLQEQWGISESALAMLRTAHH
jgi:hypothetical protein